MIAKTPRVRILERIKGILDNADLTAMTGTPDIRVRHTRNRWSAPDELPCISIRMVSDETDVAVTQMEEQRRLVVDIQVDAELATEDSEIDPTGLDRLDRIGTAALMVLFDRDATDADGNFLRGLCDRVEDEGIDPDEDNEADEARFIQRISVLYRTAFEQPDVLLAEEESLP